MAVANAGTVQVDFAANAAAFARQLDRGVAAPLKSLEARFSGLESAARKALGFLSVGIAVNFVRSAAQAADEAGKLADKLNISTESLAAFQVAAELAGTSQETLNKLLLDAQRRLGDAALGTGEALRVLHSLGLNIRELQSLAPDQLFLRYSDAIATLKNRSDQFSAAQALFGRSAQEAFTLIEAGRPAIEEAAGTVNRLGLALSRVDIAKIEAANDQIGLLGRTAQAFGQQVAAAIAPYITDFVTTLENSGVAADGARSKIDEFARGTYVALNIAANAWYAFDLAVSSGIAIQAKQIELLATALRAGFELTAKLDASVGLDSLAKRFSSAAKAASNAENLAAALGEEAGARIKAAADNIKSFEQIFAQADAIFQRAQQRAEAAVAARAEANAQLATGGTPEIEAFNTNLLLKEDLLKLSQERMLEQKRIFAEASAALETQIDHDSFVRQQTEREQAAIQAEQNILEVRRKTAIASVGLLGYLLAGHDKVNKAISAANKAAALVDIYRRTAQAATLAIATIPPPLGFAAAAANIAFGLVQAASVISERPPGGASIGTPTNPVFTETGSSSASTQTSGAQQRPIIQIQVQGMLTTEAAARQLAGMLKDVIDNHDVYIMSADSAQSQIIRSN